MSKTEAKKIVKKYAKKLKSENYPYSAIYLFGSYTKNKQDRWSDIDIAVVSDKLKKNKDRNRLLLWKMRRDIDLRIEPHGFTTEDFQDQNNPMVFEIKKSGIKII